MKRLNFEQYNRKNVLDKERCMIKATAFHHKKRTRIMIIVTEFKHSVNC